MTDNNGCGLECREALINHGMAVPLPQKVASTPTLVHRRRAEGTTQ